MSDLRHLIPAPDDGAASARMSSLEQRIAALEEQTSEYAGPNGRFFVARRTDPAKPGLWQEYGVDGAGEIKSMPAPGGRSSATEGHVSNLTPTLEIDGATNMLVMEERGVRDCRYILVAPPPLMPVDLITHEGDPDESPPTWTYRMYTRDATAQRLGDEGQVPFFRILGAVAVNEATAGLAYRDMSPAGGGKWKLWTANETPKTGANGCAPEV